MRRHGCGPDWFARSGHCLSLLERDVAAGSAVDGRQRTAWRDALVRPHLVSRPRSRSDSRLRLHGGSPGPDGFPESPGVSMDCRLLPPRGRLSDERGSGHQIACRILEYRDLGRRPTAAKDQFGPRRQPDCAPGSSRHQVGPAHGQIGLGPHTLAVGDGLGAAGRWPAYRSGGSIVMGVSASKMPVKRPCEPSPSANSTSVDPTMRRGLLSASGTFQNCPCHVPALRIVTRLTG